jgi:hypothetical protein
VQIIGMIIPIAFVKDASVAATNRCSLHAFLAISGDIGSGECSLQIRRHVPRSNFAYSLEFNCCRYRAPFSGW